MKADKAFKVVKILAIIFLISLLPMMILAYDGYRFALVYCNGLSAFSGIVLDGLRKVFEGLQNALTAVLQK